MKKIAGLCVLIMFLLPAVSTAKIEMNNNIQKNNRVDITKCVSPVSAFDNLIIGKTNNIIYKDFIIEIEYDGDVYCEVTLNGTIETDYGTVTFKDFKFKITGEDCIETAIAILKSLTEPKTDPTES